MEIRADDGPASRYAHCWNTCLGDAFRDDSRSDHGSAALCPRRRHRPRHRGFQPDSRRRARTPRDSHRGPASGRPEGSDCGGPRPASARRRASRRTVFQALGPSRVSARPRGRGLRHRAPGRGLSDGGASAGQVRSAQRRHRRPVRRAFPRRPDGGRRHGRSSTPAQGTEPGRRRDGVRRGRSPGTLCFSQVSPPLGRGGCGRPCRARRRAPGRRAPGVRVGGHPSPLGQHREPLALQQRSERRLDARRAGERDRGRSGRGCGRHTDLERRAEFDDQLHDRHGRREPDPPGRSLLSLRLEHLHVGRRRHRLRRSRRRRVEHVAWRVLRDHHRGRRVAALLLHSGSLGLDHDPVRPGPRARPHAGPGTLRPGLLAARRVPR